jgi:hypothetical protein
LRKVLYFKELLEKLNLTKMEGFLKIKLIFINGKLVCGLEGKFFEENNVLLL